MVNINGGRCSPNPSMSVNVLLACIDFLISIIAFVQLLRIHSRSSQLGWTRQKVFHLLLGSSSIGSVFYFVFTLSATCKMWPWWSKTCSFIFMAAPDILFLAAYLLLLSFWVDLCHQAVDEDDEDDECSPRQALLEKTHDKSHTSRSERHRKCFPLRFIHVGSRQKIVILVTVSVFVMMIVSAVLIWVGTGNNLIDSSLVARVYVDISALSTFLLGGALAYYGLLLFFKMRRVRSERASSEMWKVAGLAVVSVICFISSALVALFTDIPLLYLWQYQQPNGDETVVLLILYYFIEIGLERVFLSDQLHVATALQSFTVIQCFPGSSVPSAFVLWVMRELPPLIQADTQEETRRIVFVSDGSAQVHHSQNWAATTSLQNQISRASPI